METYTCEICEDYPLGPEEVVTITATTRKGELLDTQTVCRGCAVQIGFSLRSVGG